MILARDASFPVGTAKLSGSQLVIVQPMPMALDGWDFDGLEVFIDADVVVSNSRLKGPVGAAHLLHIGEAGHSPVVTINGGEIDGTGLNGNAGEGCVSLGTGTLNSSTNWHDAPRDYLSMFGGSWNSLGDRMGLCGTGVGPGSHVEGAHINGGIVRMNGSSLDFRLRGRPAPTCGWTGLIYLQSKTGAIDAKIWNTQLLGAADLGLLYAIQTDTRVYPISLEMRGNPVEPSSRGKTIGDSTEAGGKLKLTSAFNVNALTGGSLNVGA